MGKSKARKKSEVPPPYALALVICDAIWRDPGSGKRTILGCFSVIHARQFPAVHPIMAVYVAVTDGRGKVPIILQLVDSEDEGAPLFRGEVDAEFRDPRVIVELDFHIGGLTFPKAG